VLEYRSVRHVACGFEESKGREVRVFFAESDLLENMSATKYRLIKRNQDMMVRY
jgi:hypothetical protein